MRFAFVALVACSTAPPARDAGVDASVAEAAAEASVDSARCRGSKEACVAPSDCCSGLCGPSIGEEHGVCR